MEKKPLLVIARKGEKPDLTKAAPFDQVVPELFKGWEKDQELELYEFDNEGKSVVWDYSKRNQLKAIYAANRLLYDPTKVQIRDAAGNSRPMVDPAKLAANPQTAVGDSLEQLKLTKGSGIFSEADNMWLLPPQEQNPTYESDLTELSTWLHQTIGTPVQEATDPTGAPTSFKPADEAYPMELSNEDQDFFPGLNGNKVLEGTLNFLANSHFLVRFGIGAVGGMLAYRAMGIKGIVGMVLLAMMLKRVLTMGAKVMETKRVDLVTRALRDGIPVDKDGRVNKEVLDAMLRFPCGDHELETREIADPTVNQMSWDKRPIKIDPDIVVRSSDDNLAQATDGDTLTGTSGIRYRLAGVDTPELHYQGVHEPGAQRARERVLELIPAGTKVRIETISNQPVTDERVPAYVYFKDPEGNEQCLNRILLQEGLARPTTFHPYHPHMHDYLNDFMGALENKVGLWNKRYNPMSAPKPGLFSVTKATNPTPAGGQETSFSLG